jgi:hypothetical protein
MFFYQILLILLISYIIFLQFSESIVAAWLLLLMCS